MNFHHWRTAAMIDPEGGAQRARLNEAVQDVPRVRGQLLAVAAVRGKRPVWWGASLLAILVAGLVLGSPLVAQHEPPLPIVFVHGIGSHAQMWTDSGLLPFLQGYGWQPGAVCRISYALTPQGTVSSLADGSPLNCTADDMIFLVNFEKFNGPDPDGQSNCGAIFLQAKAIALTLDAIRNLKGASFEKAVLVGHSMGGLAAAAYLIADGDANGQADFYAGRSDVAKLVTLGSPFGGANSALFSSVFTDCELHSNAERDLRKEIPLVPNPFLFGGFESSVGAGFWDDVNANGLHGNFDMPGLRERAFPGDVETFWLVGSGTSAPGENGDCIVELANQRHPSIYETKVVDAVHASGLLSTFCLNDCAEASAFRPIIEALDEADAQARAWPVGTGRNVTGFITHPGDTVLQPLGTDHDWFRFAVSPGAGSLNFTAGAVGIDLLEVVDEDNRVILSNRTLVPFETVSVDLLFPASSATGYLHVMGQAEGFPSGVDDAGRDACETGPEFPFPPVDSPYHFRITAPVAPTLSVMASPTAVVRPGSTTLTLSLRSPANQPIGSTPVWLRTPLPPGGYSGCTITAAGCETITNGSGVATIQYTPSADGTLSFTATSALGGLGSLQLPVGSGGLTVTASPSTVVVNSSTTLTATVGGGVTPLAGRVVTFSTTHPALFFGTSCTFSPCTATTNASGVATIGLTPYASGTAQVSVSSPDLQGTVVAIPVTPPSNNFTVTLAVFFQNGDAGSSTYEIEATVRTAEGQPIVGERVDWATTRGTLTSSWSSTASTGIAQTHLTVTSSGSTSVTATVRGTQFTTTFQAQVGASGSGPMVPVRQLTVGSGAVYGLTWAANGSILVAADYGGSVRAWDAATGGVLWSATASDNNVGQVAASPDGSRILVGNSDGFDVYQASNGQVLATVDFVPAADRIVNSAFLTNTSFIRNDRRSLFTHSSLASAGSSVYTVPAADDDFDFSGHMAWSPSRSWVAAVNSSGVIFVNNSSNGSLVRREDMGSGPAARGAGDTAFDSTSSRLLATAFNTIRVYDLAAGNWSYVSYTAQGLGNNEKLGATFLDSDNKLAIGGSGKVEVLSRLDGSSFRLGAVPGWAWEIAWNPSRQELAVGSDGGNVTIFQPLAPIDSLAPGINVSVPVDNLITFANAVTTTGQVSDASGISAFTINGANVTLGTGGVFNTSVPLAPGNNVLTYSATDAATNVGTVQRTVTRVVDTSPPTISGVSASPSVVALGAQVTVSATIVDGDTGVATGEVLLRNGVGALVATVPLIHGSGSSYSCSLATATYGSGGFAVDVRATDSSPQANQATSAGVASFQVQTAAALRLAIPSLDFGSVVAGSSTTLPVTLYNDGQATLSGTASTASPFAIVSGTPFVIPGGGSAQIVVRFSPTSVVAYSGSVALTGGGGASLAVSGVGALSPGQLFRDGFETGDGRAWSFGGSAGSGPIAHYSFDTAANLGTDVAGGHHATSVTGGTGVAGLVGSGAISFNQGYMMLPSTPAFDLLAGDFTLAVFVRGNAGVNRNWFTKASATDHHYGIGGGSAPGIAFWGGGAGTALGTTSVFDGVWHHVAAVKRGALAEIWVDGVLENSAAITPGSPEGGTFALGRDGVCCEDYTGNMDEAKIWNRALSASEIVAESAPVRPVPMGHWTMNGGAADSSGNGNHLTPVNVTQTTDRLGRASSAYAFSSTAASYLGLPDGPAADQTSGFTWAGWVKFGGIGVRRELIVRKSCATAASCTHFFADTYAPGPTYTRVRSSCLRAPPI